MLQYFYRTRYKFFLPPSLFTYFLFSFWSGYRSKKFFSSCSLILINILNIELLAEIVGRRVSKSGKCEPLLTMRFHSVFVLTDYGQTSTIIESSKAISTNQPILTNRYQWIDFIQSKHWFSSENSLFSHNPS